MHENKVWVGNGDSTVHSSCGGEKEFGDPFTKTSTGTIRTGGTASDVTRSMAKRLNAGT